MSPGSGACQGVFREACACDWPWPRAGVCCLHRATSSQVRNCGNLGESNRVARATGSPSVRPHLLFQARRRLCQLLQHHLQVLVAAAARASLDLWPLTHHRGRGRGAPASRGLASGWGVTLPCPLAALPGGHRRRPRRRGECATEQPVTQASRRPGLTCCRSAPRRGGSRAACARWTARSGGRAAPGVNGVNAPGRGDGRRASPAVPCVWDQVPSPHLEVLQDDLYQPLALPRAHFHQQPAQHLIPIPIACRGAHKCDPASDWG